MLEALRQMVTGSRSVDHDVATLDDAELEAVLHHLADLRRWLDAHWLAVIAESDRRRLHHHHGHRDTASWIARMNGERPGASRRDVELAAQLSATLVVATALATGAVSKAAAAELVHAATLPPATQHELVERAAALPVEHVAAAVKRARLEHGHTPAVVTPSVVISRHGDHGRLDATLDLVDTELVDVAVHAAADTLDLPGDLPISERRARGLAALARFYLDHQESIPVTRVGRPHVLVIVDLETLEARTGGHATLGSGAVISGDDARRIAEDANVSRIITCGPSEPLDVGRTIRSVPPALAKAVITRDRHCRYGTCTAPVWACDIHHLEPWARGGPTALGNLGLLCWYHHQHVHRRGAHHLTVDADGRWRLPMAA
ncbi:MAG TPA: DUF222 domain-containing protein [Acidimicrobiales bacterium]|nr:DUF222 domain-containing protein [Acidimicrobiales bacterium]